MVEGSALLSTPKWSYRAWPVVLLLFLTLGPFGLPLLWRSPSFSLGMAAFEAPGPCLPRL